MKAIRRAPGWCSARGSTPSRAPFFIVRDDDGRETVYTSVLQLIRERLGARVSAHDHAMAIDADDIGGI
jgi:hypothetical protein